MAWTEQKFNEVYKEVQKKASTDPKFREAVLNNPNKAIEELSGEEVPETFKIKIYESDPDYHATFVLPEMISAELGNNDLEKIAGGISSGAICPIAQCPAKSCYAQTGPNNPGGGLSGGNNK